MHQQRKWVRAFGLACTTLVGCQGLDGMTGAAGAEGQDGKVGLVRAATAFPGTCADTGRALSYGVDTNGNGVLDYGEVHGADVVCDGARGGASVAPLLDVSAEPVGVHCPGGGQAVASGLDDDGDGTLARSEIMGTHYLCNGVPGALENTGISALATEPAGAHCAYGGQRIEVGIDRDADLVLDRAELRATEYVCNGARGADGAAGLNAPMWLVQVELEPAGLHCAAGGTKTSVGPDLDEHGSLEPGEVTQTEYVCNGARGADGVAGSSGQRSLVAVVGEPPGPQCAAGGRRIDSGVDADASGLLDPSEVLQHGYVCDGEVGLDGQPGARALVASAAEPAGGHCATGGWELRTGLDADGDGVLAPSETAATRYVCHGAAGAAGPASNVDGIRALVEASSEPPGPDCSAGGERIRFGLDDDGDGALAPAEVDATRFACNGVDATAPADGASGAVARANVSAEPIGSRCTAGGWRIDTGYDTDASGLLDSGEVASTSYVCHFDAFTNGSFEVAAYAGWVVTSDADGQWFLASNGTTLSASNPVFDYADLRSEAITSVGLPYTVQATDGTNAALNLQAAPGVHHLTQDFTVPSAATNLKWDMHYTNTAADFQEGAQTVAVYLRDVQSDAVLATLYETVQGDPLTLPSMTAHSADITAYRGHDVRVDFEVAALLGWLDLALDNVRID